MRSSPSSIVLSIDPGREKCGVAVCTPSSVVARSVVPAGDLVRIVAEWCKQYGVAQVLVGDRTGSAEVFRRLQEAGVGVPVTLVPEHGTTLKARRRYFQEHPPRGWRRLLPLSLQIPSEPYDDYAAIVLAEEFFERVRGGGEKILGR